jgi:hypothetical protein
MPKVQKIVVNTALVVLSTTISLFLINAAYIIVIRNPRQEIGFPRYIVPDLPPPSRWLYADTGRKDNSHDVALLGDSYLEAIGDDFSDGVYSYSLAHILRDRTNWQIFQVGTSGSHLPRQLQLYQKALNGHYWPLFQYRSPSSRPTRLLAFFYEGNDLDDVLSASRLQSSDELSVTLPWHLRWFPLGRLIHRRSDNLMQRLNAKIDAIIALFKASQSSRSASNSAPIDAPAFNAATCGGKSSSLSPIKVPPLGNSDFPSNSSCIIAGRSLQAPALELKREERDQAIKATTASLSNYVAEHPNHRMCLVYLPSPATIYSPDSFKLWRHRVGSKSLNSDYFSGKAASMASREIRAELFRQLSKKRINYIDATAELQEASKTRYLHGRDDVNHFNRYGYRVVANLLASSFLECVKVPR